MKRKKWRIAITIILSIIEFLIFFHFNIKNKIDEMIKVENYIIDMITFLTPAGIFYLVNYYLLSPIIYSIIRILWHVSGHYNYIKSSFRKLIKNCTNWLISSNYHWGLTIDADKHQSANSCEALIALRKSDMYKRKEEVYKKSFIRLLGETTNSGLPSKSLNKETVVCTSMLLYLVSMERNDSTGIIDDFSKYDKIAQNLWDCRCDFGWGIFLNKSNPEHCSFANTFWSLRALNNSDLGKTSEFKKYIKSIYEYSEKSTFGFTLGDESRLVTTAMSISLYYNLDENLRNSISSVYDVKEAIDYVLNVFLKSEQQCEIESLWGIGNVDKVPWTHISIGYVIEALSLAYYNKDLGLLKTDLFLEKVRKIIKKNIHYTNNNECYYIPDKMERSKKGIYTYPTSYFIWGLSSFI